MPNEAADLSDELLSGWEAQQMRPGYRFLPRQFLDRMKRYEQCSGAAAAAELLRGVILNLLDRVDEIRARPFRLRLTSSVEEMLALEHDRMRREYADCDPRALNLDDDLFLKDLGVAVLKLAPVGWPLIDIHQGIPRSTILRAARRSLRHGVSTASFIFFRQHGFRPALQTHLSLKRRDEFTPQGWRQAFRRIADLLAANPMYLGTFGTSWYYDPAVARISPRLAYVQELAAHGAWLAHMGVDDGMTRSALSRSQTRRAAFQAGSYRPRVYMMIWPRRALLAYAAADE